MLFNNIGLWETKTKKKIRKKETTRVIYLLCTSSSFVSFVRSALRRPTVQMIDHWTFLLRNLEAKKNNERWSAFFSSLARSDWTMSRSSPLHRSSSSRQFVNSTRWSAEESQGERPKWVTTSSDFRWPNHALVSLQLRKPKQINSYPLKNVCNEWNVRWAEKNVVLKNVEQVRLTSISLCNRFRFF